MNLSLCSILAEPARRYPDRIAVVQGDRRISYADLWHRARRYAAALREAGVRPDQRVALLAPNVVEFPAAYYAIAALGAVVVPVHLLLTAEEIGYVMRDSGSTVLVAATSYAAVAAEVTGHVDATVVTVGAGGTLDERAADLEPLGSFAGRVPDDPAVVFYTSGTTGLPKGAVLTQLNLVLNATVNAFDSTGASRDDIVLGCLPLFHSFGQTVAMNCTFRRAATLVLQPRFDAAAAIDLMAAERVNVFLGVPTMFIALLAVAAERTSLPALEHCVSGGDSLPVTVLQRFNATFRTTVYEGYGLSESSPSATVNQPVFGTRDGTVGHPVWGVEVEIARQDVDEHVELLSAADELGEVVIRGHNVFAGYLGRPEETAAVLQDGWLRTGDLGVKDAEGFISIVDRKKDLIIRGGFNVYPREVEEALLRHPAVAQVAAIGLPDDKYGEEVCAVVVRAPGSAVSAEEIVDWSREHLGRHQYPRRVEFLDEMPLGPSMKVLKRELRRRFS